MTIGDDSRFSRSPLTDGWEVIGSPNPIPAVFAAREPAQMHPTSFPACGGKITTVSLVTKEEQSDKRTDLESFPQVILDSFVFAQPLCSFRSSRYDNGVEVEFVSFGEGFEMSIGEDLGSS